MHIIIISSHPCSKRGAIMTNIYEVFICLLFLWHCVGISPEYCVYCVFYYIHYTSHAAC